MVNVGLHWCEYTASHVAVFAGAKHLQMIFLTQPEVAILLDEGVVVEMRVGSVNPVDLFLLSGRQSLLRVETPDSFQQSLAPQHFVQTGDAAVESVRRVEKRGIRVRDLRRPGQELGRRRGGTVNFVEQLDRLPRPDRP